MGRLARVNPQGVDMAGKPVALLGLGDLAFIPAPGPRTGYARPPRTTVSMSMRQAATGAAGVTSKSTSWSTQAFLLAPRVSPSHSCQGRRKRLRRVRKEDWLSVKGTST